MNKFKCPVCGNERMSPDGLFHHVDKEHHDSLQGMSPKQYVFNRKYKLTKPHGKSVISGKPTAWNEELGRYERFADESERKKYREIFLERMQKTYGKDTLLNDPDVQKKMLAARKISGTYKFSSGKEVTYTGEYEKHFLEVMDTLLRWPPEDLFLPAPQVIDYHNPKTGKMSFYIPDAYISSLNLIVEIKSEENKGYRERDIEIENAKDAATIKKGYRFVKIPDMQYAPLLNAVIEARNDQWSDGGVYDS
jgi:hypothetical protein